MIGKSLLEKATSVCAVVKKAVIALPLMCTSPALNTVAVESKPVVWRPVGVLYSDAAWQLQWFSVVDAAVQ
jgi:hypothetical protein